MSVVGNLSRHLNLGELATPRDFPTVQSVAVRQAQARMNLGLPAVQGNTATALNATGTLTAAMIVGGIVTSTTASAVTATLDTGSLLEAALKTALGTNALSNGPVAEFTVVNTGGSNAFTIATAAGWTDGGGGFQAVGAGTTSQFRIVRTAANTYTLVKEG